MTMIRINLLPESSRKSSLSQIEQFHRTPLMWLAAGAMILFPLMAWLPIRMRSEELKQLNAKIQILEPKKAEVDQLQRTLQQLRAQEAAFRGVGIGQGLWSKRLNTISNATPDGVWFTELALDQPRGLVMQGSAIGDGGSGMASVGRLVQILKDDLDFSKTFKEIQIESIKTVPEGELELVQFTLTCLPLNP